MLRLTSYRNPNGWFLQCATSKAGPEKKSVTPLRFPRLIRGCCSIGRGRKYVVFLKIIIRIQARSASATARSLKETWIVADSELTCKELTELITDYLEQMRLTIKALGAKPRGEIPQAIESDLLQAFRRWKNSR